MLPIPVNRLPLGDNHMATDSKNKKPRFTSPLPAVDDVRGAIQDILTSAGGFTKAASGNDYFRVDRAPMVVGGIHGEVSVTWNNLLEASSVENRRTETAAQVLANLSDEQKAKALGISLEKFQELMS